VDALVLSKVHQGEGRSRQRAHALGERLHLINQREDAAVVDGVAVHVAQRCAGGLGEFVNDVETSPF
jgi:hypothetical protein